MKRLIILGLVFVLFVVITIPALAKTAAPTICGVPPTQLKQRYALAGYITALNPSTQTVSVLVATGNRLAKPCLQMVVVLDAKTAILKYSGGGTLTFDKLVIGQSVSSNGFLSAVNIWKAKRISVGAALISK